MPHGLKRFQRSGQSHFVTFTCYHRRVRFNSAVLSDLFVAAILTPEPRCDADCSKNRAGGSGAVFAITRFGKKDSGDESEWTARDREQRATSGTQNLGRTWGQNLGTEPGGRTWENLGTDGMYPVVQTMRHRTCVGPAQKESTVSANYFYFNSSILLARKRRSGS
jgi:hypothetical protein